MNHIIRVVLAVFSLLGSSLSTWHVPATIEGKPINPIFGTIESSKSLKIIEVDQYLVYLPIVVKPLPTPQLISPQNGAGLETLIPTFSWDVAVPIGTYAYMCLAVGTAPDPISCVYIWGGIFSPHYENILNSNLNPKTVYYWRVGIDTSDNFDKAMWSETRSFTSGSGGVIPSAPILLTPSDNSSNYDYNVYFSWQPVGGAVGYDLYYRDVNKTYWWVERNLSTNEWSNNAGAYSVNHYEWFVIARNNYAWGSRSQVWDFYQIN